MQVYYLVYKLTNLVNGKIYVGCHMTKNVDDGYMGSGKRLGYAKKKYGVENFKKEILSVHETPEEMLAEETRIVNEEFVGRDDVYNLKCGGRGGWLEVNSSRDKTSRIKGGLMGRATLSQRLATDLAFRKDYLERCRVQMNQRHINQEFDYNKWRVAGLKVVMTKESIEKRKDSYQKIAHQQGSKNSQFGKCWITNGVESKSIKKIDLSTWENLGWKRGRKKLAR